MKKKITIATHDGKFHADEVLALAVLKMIYPNAEIIRTRDLKKLEKANIRVDVGKKYNTKTKDFDHHQISFNGERDNGIKYASAGLIWKHYGDKITSNKIVDIIDEKLFQYVDAIDNGTNTCTIEIVKPFDICDIINSLNPSWPHQSKEEFTKGFHIAIKLAGSIIKREINKSEEKEKAKKLLKKFLDKNTNKEYLVLEEYIPWKDSIVGKTNLKYIISKEAANKTWHTNAVPDKTNSFKTIKPFPKEWAGLEGKDLEKVTGINGSIFCHKNLFICIANSKEAAIKLTELSLSYS